MKTFFIQLTVFVLLLGCLQYAAGLYQQNQMIAADFYQAGVLRKLYGKNADIVFLCDSVNAYLSPADVDTSAISKLLQKELKGPEVHAIAGGAFQMNLFREMVETLMAKGTRPSMVIIPVSIRSFGIRWDLNPSWQFAKQMVILKSERNLLYRTFAKPMLVFKAVELAPVSSQNLAQASVFVSNSYRGTMEEIQTGYLESGDVKTRLEWQVKLGYMFTLDPQHRFLESMRQLVRLLKKENIPFFLYVVPVDWDAGVTAAGQEFSECMDSNIATIKTVLREEDAPIYDLSRSIPSKHFHYPGPHIDEHLDEGGRSLMAKLLAERVRINMDPPKDK